MNRTAVGLCVAATMAVTPAACASQSRADTMTSGCFRYSVRTDHATYRRGAPVTVVVTRTDVTNHSCDGRSCGGVTPWFQVFNARGKLVYTQSAVGIACVRNPPPPAVIRPGHDEVWTDGPWEQRAPAGRYRITWRWLEDVSVSTAWFSITR